MVICVRTRAVVSALLVVSLGLASSTAIAAPDDTTASITALSYKAAEKSVKVVPDSNTSMLSMQPSAPAGAERNHTFGVGGRAGGFSFGVGGSGRYWASDRIGVQADVSHYGLSTVGITQFAPSVLTVLGQPDLTKATQIRPYAGGGLNVLRVTQDFGSIGFSEFNSSDTGIGFQGFAGAEAVFGGAPNFGVSGDLGYYSTGDFFGVNVGGFALSLAGHYYFK